MIARTFVGTTALLAAMGAVAEAQRVPRLAVSLESGNGPHTMQAGTTYFRQEHSETAVLAATLRLAQWDRVAPVLRLEQEIAPRLVYTSDCPVAPDGSCREHFRQPDGVAASLGAMVGVTRWLSLGASYGRQWPGGGYSQELGEARAVISPWRYVGVSGAIRRLSWDDPQYGRLWHRLHFIGLQAQLP